MPTVPIGTDRYTVVRCDDEPGPGGANHRYTVIQAGVEDDSPVAVYAYMAFQKGPILEEGVNGCYNEDLLAIVIHRLEGFQSSEYVCDENANAITKLKEAMHWLNHRTEARQRRGVEGTNVV